MRPRSIITAVVAGIAIVGALGAMALARGKTHPTSLTIRAYSLTADPGLIFGSLDSDTRNCVAGRSVNIYSAPAPGGPFVQTDSTHASSHGAFAGVVDRNQNAFKAVAPKETYGPKHHHKTCAKASATILAY